MIIVAQKIRLMVCSKKTMPSKDIQTVSNYFSIKCLRIRTVISRSVKGFPANVNTNGLISVSSK